MSFYDRFRRKKDQRYLKDGSRIGELSDLKETYQAYYGAMDEARQAKEQPWSWGSPREKQPKPPGRLANLLRRLKR
jgi:hypothetical protein